MSKPQVVEFCGAFNGRASLRRGETIEQCAERVQEALQKAIDGHARRYDVNLDIDYGDLRLEPPQEGLKSDN